MPLVKLLIEKDLSSKELSKSVKDLIAQGWTVSEEDSDDDFDDDDDDDETDDEEDDD